ncbi:RNase H domain-containing protein [Trichonephila clavipes]|uniref:RNase H domain-containing protein n=1 Tax=Trichonephila clavipes TaxID=2585209 RepID=A0A8X7B9X7_TRICX|nr:RNase H domain-containing protein [Trichonephila clavipes]
MTQVNDEPLTYHEQYSKCKASINISWKQPPPYPMYLSQCPRASVSFKSDRRDQTTLARLSTGHLKSFKFSHGAKTFQFAPSAMMQRLNCNIYLIAFTL